MHKPAWNKKKKRQWLFVRTNNKEMVYQQAAVRYQPRKHFDNDSPWAEGIIRRAPKRQTNERFLFVQ